MTDVTFEEVATRWADRISRQITTQYRRYGVEREDVKQEILLFLYSVKGKKKVEKYLANGQHARINFELTDVARAYAELQKAEKVGYEYDDVQWYSAGTVLAALPLALDETYDGRSPLDYERGGEQVRRGKTDPRTMYDAMAVVMDVRRALGALPEWVQLNVLICDPGDPGHDAAIEAIVQYLGGTRPTRRKSMSNAQAIAITRSGEE